MIIQLYTIAYRTLLLLSVRERHNEEFGWSFSFRLISIESLGGKRYDGAVLKNFEGLELCSYFFYGNFLQVAEIFLMAIVSEYYLQDAD